MIGESVQRAACSVLYMQVAVMARTGSGSESFWKKDVYCLQRVWYGIGGYVMCCDF